MPDGKLRATSASRRAGSRTLPGVSTVAGAVREDPLELLSRERLRHFLGAAARPFRVVLIDTPAAERGPDLEMFAALAGGALLVVRPGEDAARLARLRRRLTRCAARPVATVFNQS